MKSARADLVPSVDDDASLLRPATALAYAKADAEEVALTATTGSGLLVLAATGHQLLAALERALARYPSWSDDFPHVSAGLHVAFDAANHPGHRLVRGGVTLHGAPVDPARRYTVATTPRFARAAFLGGENPRGAPDVLVDAADGPVLPAILRNLLIDAKALARGGGLARTLATSKRALDRLASPGGPLKRTGEGVVLIPEKTGRITAL